MKNRRQIGGCQPSVIQFKRESAHLAAGTIWRYVTLGQLCQTLGVAKGSSKPEATHCQYRYPSPNGWSDHTRVRPPTPFRGIYGQGSAGFAPKPLQNTPSIVPVWETIPCDSLSKVAHQVSSGAKKSGEHICSILSKYSAFWASWQPSRPVRAAASNVRQWAQLAVHLLPRCLTPTWPVARFSAAWLVQLVTKLGFASTNTTALKSTSRAAGAFALVAF